MLNYLDSITEARVFWPERVNQSWSGVQNIVYPELAGNAVLVLIAVACALLDRQMARLAEEFENQGGFSERLHRIRSRKRGY